MAGTKPTPENKLVARHAAKAFGGKPQVYAFHHDEVPLSIDILSCEDRPVEGVTSYSTIGLSGHPMPYPKADEFPLRIELAGACASGADLFPNMLASASFYIRRSNSLFAPGAVLRGYIAEYYPETTVPHLYLTAPFLWEESLKTLDVGSKRVSWLLIVPVTDAEVAYLNDNGEDAFESLLEEAQIDLYDLSRPSAV